MSEHKPEHKTEEANLRPWWHVALETVAWLAMAAVFLLLPSLLDIGKVAAVVPCYVLAFSLAVFGSLRPRAIKRGTPWRKHLLYCLAFAAMLCVFIVLAVAASFFIVRFL